VGLELSLCLSSAAFLLIKGGSYLAIGTQLVEALVCLSVFYAIAASSKPELWLWVYLLYNIYDIGATMVYVIPSLFAERLSYYYHPWARSKADDADSVSAEFKSCESTIPTTHSTNIPKPYCCRCSLLRRPPVHRRSLLPLLRRHHVVACAHSQDRIRSVAGDGPCPGLVQGA